MITVERQAAEKQQDHHGCQQRCDDAFDGDALDGAAHERRLVADIADLDPVRQRRAVIDHLLLDAGDDIQRRHRAGLQHLHDDRTAAVDMDDIGLRRITVAHSGDVAHIEHGAVDAADRQVAEFVDLHRGIVEIDGVFERTDLLGTDRRDQVLRGQCVGNVLAGQAARLQRAGVEIDGDLPLLAAERKRNRRAGHGDELRAQLVEGDVLRLLFVEAFAGQRDVDDRHRRRRVVQDQRRSRARRRLPDQRLGNRRDLGVGGADIDIGLEEDLDDAEAGIGIRRDVFDVIDRGGQRTLERRGDAPGHLVRRQAGIAPDNADDGDADLGENIRRRAQSRQRADDQKQQREHDESIGSAQRNAHQSNHRTGIPQMPWGRCAGPSIRRQRFT